ncbi:MAG: hypothetical protein RIQ81_326 [Pseudomonadota bacterium]
MLKLAHEQISATGQNLPAGVSSKHLGWAETHAFYSSFVHAELILGLDDATTSAPERQLQRDSVPQMIAAHCVMLRSSGTLRILPANDLSAGLMRELYRETEAIKFQEVMELGRFALNPRLQNIPRKTVIDIAPSVWCTSEDGKALAKSMSWLVKRAERESQLRRR